MHQNQFFKKRHRILSLLIVFHWSNTLMKCWRRGDKTNRWKLWSNWCLSILTGLTQVFHFHHHLFQHKCQEVHQCCYHPASFSLTSSLSDVLDTTEQWHSHASALCQMITLGCYRETPGTWCYTRRVSTRHRVTSSSGLLASCLILAQQIAY